MGEVVCGIPKIFIVGWLLAALDKAFYLSQHLNPKHCRYDGRNKLVHFSVYFVFCRRLGINNGIAKTVFPLEP
jgi:hypothetical protein